MQQVQLGRRVERRKQGFRNRRLLDGNSSFAGELPEFALSSRQFVRLQPPRTQKGYSYAYRGGLATAKENAKEQDNHEGQCNPQWIMWRHADVHEVVPRTVATSRAIR